MGAAGKSAQFPLYVWLPDAMEGPTPVSALIHAATMVTAGVYLLSRMSPLFLLSPAAMTVVAAIGLFTALLAATIALAQNDIKKVLAYSTVSQLGFMFLACGVGAFGAAMFHVVTHAFFKALLFLGSGSVIHAMGGEQDMRKMGGLFKKLPLTGIAMLIGTLAISGIPIFAGFWSKDAILLDAFAGPSRGGLGGPALLGSRVFDIGADGLLYDPDDGENLFRRPSLRRAHRRAPARVAALDDPAARHPLDPLRRRGLSERRSSGDPCLRPLAGAGREDPRTCRRDAGVATLDRVGGAGRRRLRLGVPSRFRNVKSGEYAPESLRRSALYKLVANRWGIDDFVESELVIPGTHGATWLWRHLDARGADGAVNGFARAVRLLGERLIGWQSGYVRSYALTMLLGVVLVVLVCLAGRTR